VENAVSVEKLCTKGAKLVEILSVEIFS